MRGEKKMWKVGREGEAMHNRRSFQINNATEEFWIVLKSYPFVFASQIGSLFFQFF